MKVLIAGATGVLGRRLVQQLRDRGHSAIALVRSAKGEQIVQSLGADSCWVDVFDAEAIARGASGVDIVIHAATSIPVKNRTTPTDWEMNEFKLFILPPIPTSLREFIPNKRIEFTFTEGNGLHIERMSEKSFLQQLMS